jgi:hypothetical protein
MKTLLPTVLLLGLATMISPGQTLPVRQAGVHSVTPDTKGNTIELTVTNESNSTPVEDVRVTITRCPEHLTFTSTEQIVRSIPPAHNSEVRFTFNVTRSAPIHDQDTLGFSITDARGLMLTKSMIVRYSAPSTFALDQNFPNPFNPTTTIRYQVPLDSRVALRVYDILGREVQTLVDEAKPAGFHEATMNATTVASGVYFCRLEVSSLTSSLIFAYVDIKSRLRVEPLRCAGLPRKL